jgi:gluconate 5-dehydrogenase
MCGGRSNPHDAAAQDGPVTAANPFDLTGRVAIVTGGGRGLGLAMAEALARAGAAVYITGRNLEALEASANGLRAEKLNVTPLPFDVADAAAGVSAVDEVAAREGRLDILVNNVGQRFRAPIEEIGEAEFGAMLGVNVGAPYLLSRAAAVHMKRGGYGRIILLSSSATRRARAGDAAYIASKGAIEALTRALACEWGLAGITTNAISPGPFATETNSAMANDPEVLEMIRRTSPTGRWGEPHEIGGACVFLASPAASYVNGAVLTVDGGIAIGSPTGR